MNRKTQVNETCERALSVPLTKMNDAGLGVYGTNVFCAAHCAEYRLLGTGMNCAGVALVSMEKRSHPQNSQGFD